MYNYLFISQTKEFLLFYRLHIILLKNIFIFMYIARIFMMYFLASDVIN